MKRREWINSVLSGVDELLLRKGYVRRKSEHEWKRTHANGDIERIHFNFGLALINPSLAVEYVDLKTLLPDNVGVKTSTFRMLSALSGVSYDESTSFETFRDHLERFGAPELERLHDRNWVVDELLVEDARTWPTWSYSARIRLLPLLLASLGRLTEARELVEMFANDSSRPDQIIPKYDVFREHFYARFGSGR